MLETTGPINTSKHTDIIYARVRTATANIISVTNRVRPLDDTQLAAVGNTLRGGPGACGDRF